MNFRIEKENYTIEVTPLAKQSDVQYYKVSLHLKEPLVITGAMMSAVKMDNEDYFDVELKSLISRNMR